MNSIIPCEDCTSSHFINRNATYGKFKLDTGGTIQFTFLDQHNTFDWKILLISGTDKDSTSIAHELTIDQSTFNSGIDVIMTAGLYVMEVVANGSDLQTGMLRLKMHELAAVTLDCDSSTNGYISIECANYNSVVLGSGSSATFIVSNTDKYISVTRNVAPNSHYSIDIDSHYLKLISTTPITNIHNTTSFDTSTLLVDTDIILTFEYINTGTAIPYDDISINIIDFGKYVVDYWQFKSETIDNFTIGNVDLEIYNEITITPNVSPAANVIHTDVYYKYSNVMLYDKSDVGLHILTTGDTYTDPIYSLNTINYYGTKDVLESTVNSIKTFMYADLLNVGVIDEAEVVDYLQGLEIWLVGYTMPDSYGSVDSYPLDLVSERTANIIEVISGDTTTTRTYNFENRFITFKFSVESAHSYDFVLSSELEIYDVLYNGTFVQTNFVPSGEYDYIYITVRYTGSASSYSGHIINIEN